MKKILLLSFLISSAFAQDIDQLSQDITWRRLLHYNKTLLGIESEADDERFFLAEDGRDHPAHELQSTVAAFKANNKEVICRFPARYIWLKKVISLDAFDFKRCGSYTEFKNKTQAKSATLVFSSYYIDTPASAFGHTFLRLNSHSTDSIKNEKVDLLDYGANYGARVDNDPALFYIFKSLFGLYPGDFTVLPYYYKVREYSDFEMRDVWEYDLSLNSEQLEMIVAHIWEMSLTRFNYWYLTENCSYRILALINLVLPESNLIESIPHYVIPIDTVRAVVEEPGLVIRKEYRPSALTKLEVETKDLPYDELVLVKKLADRPKEYSEKIDVFSTNKKKAEILDKTILAMDFLYAKDLILDKGKKKNDKHELLLLRAENPEISETKTYKVEPKMFPDQAHRSGRVEFGQGYSPNDGQFQQLSIKFALHDLLDPLAGQPPFSEITFADVGLRLQEQNYSSSRKLLINHLDIFRLKSYQPVTFWQQNVSWSMRIGMGTLRDEVMTDKLSSTIELGGGGTVGFGNNQTSIITLLTKLELNQQDHFGHGWRVGAGPELSARFVLSDKLSLGLLSSYKWRHYFTDNDFSSTSFQRGGELRWHLNSSWSIFMKTDWYDIKSQTNQWSELGFYAYF